MSRMDDNNPVLATPSQEHRVLCRIATYREGEAQGENCHSFFCEYRSDNTTEGRRDLSSPPTSPKYEDQAYTPEYSRENDKTASLASIPGKSSKFFLSSQLECLLCQSIMT